MKKQLDRRGALAIAALSSVLVTPGCAVYQPPQLPTEEVATISIDPEASQLTFCFVDGQALSRLFGVLPFPGLDTQKLLPGKRSVTVQYRGTTSSGSVGEGRSTLTFEARSGERYVVHVRNKRYSEVYFYNWITDASGAEVPSSTSPY